MRAGSGSPLSLGLEGACKTICGCGVVSRSALSVMHVVEVGGQTIVLAIASCRFLVPFNAFFKSCARPIHTDSQLLSPLSRDAQPDVGTRRRICGRRLRVRNSSFQLGGRCQPPPQSNETSVMLKLLEHLYYARGSLPIIKRV